jgi:hypothetical protein
MAVGIRHADYATLLYPQKLALTPPTSGGRSVVIDRSRTQATEFLVFSTFRCYTNRTDLLKARFPWRLFYNL